jgi:hypothetical protein
LGPITTKELDAALDTLKTKVKNSKAWNIKGANKTMRVMKKHVATFQVLLGCGADPFHADQCASLQTMLTSVSKKISAKVLQAAKVGSGVGSTRVDDIVNHVMGTYVLDAVGALAPSEQSIEDEPRDVVLPLGAKSNWRKGWFTAAKGIFQRDGQRSAPRRPPQPIALTLEDSLTFATVSSHLATVRAVYVVHMAGVRAAGTTRDDVCVIGDEQRQELFDKNWGHESNPFATRTPQMVTTRDIEIASFEDKLSLDDVTRAHNKEDAIKDNFRGHAVALHVALTKNQFPCVVLEDNVILRYGQELSRVLTS